MDGLAAAFVIMHLTDINPDGVVSHKLVNYFLDLSENKSDIILIESFNSLDWLHTLNLAFNYLLINAINYF